MCSCVEQGCWCHRGGKLLRPGHTAGVKEAAALLAAAKCISGSRRSAGIDSIWGDEVFAFYVYVDFFLFSLALFDLGCRHIQSLFPWPLLQGTRSCDATILNHPSIKKFLESPSRSSSPAHQGSDAPSANHSESDSLSQHNDFFLDKDNGSLDADERLANSLDQRQSRSAGRDSLGVSSSQKPGQRNAGLSNDETSRLYVKKTIVVGNVSKLVSRGFVVAFVSGSSRITAFFNVCVQYSLIHPLEPPFHLTRRGWGEFPVRVQIHFKDSQNKRIDIIHNLKVFDLNASEEVGREGQGSCPFLVSNHSPVLHATFYSLPSSIERTPTKLATQKVPFGSHGNSAFQPIAASCKIVPQGQIPSPAESPGKSFQPITMSCKIVSGSPISTPSPSPLPRTPTSTPVHMKQGSASSVINNPYVIVDKPGQMVGAAATSTGSPTSKLSSVCQASHGAGSPVPKSHGSSFVTSAVKVMFLLGCTSHYGHSFQNVSSVKRALFLASGICFYFCITEHLQTLLFCYSYRLVAVLTLLTCPVLTLHFGFHVLTCDLFLEQGTFLVGQPSPQSSGKQLTPASVVQGNVGVGASSTQGQALKVITGQKTALFTQATASGQTSLMKISDGSLKSVSASSQLSKPGTTVLRVSGGVITTAAAPAVALPTNGVAQQIDNAGSSSSSSGAPTAKTSGQQHQVCINQTQCASSVGSKTATSTVVSVASLVTTPTPVTGKAAVSGLLKIHSNQSSPQQAVLTVPSQLKQLGVNTASGGVQTILMPMNKVIQSLSTSKVSAVTAVTSASTAVSSPSVASITKVKMEPDSTGQNCTSVGTQEGQTAVKTEENSELGNYNLFYLTYLNLILFLVLCFLGEDVSSYCASSVEQYYSWNIGKRRAAEWQRAMTVRKILQEIIEKHPRFHSITPLKTKHVVQWCRCHGYTPPDPETLRNDEDSIEDVLTQIDSEPGEQAETENSFLPEALLVKLAQEWMCSPTGCLFRRRNFLLWIGISFQPAEVQRNVYASVIEDMILKATEQLMSDILRQALAVAYQTAPHNRTPREITVMNIHKAICNIPFLDFLTNKHMKILNEEQ
uniref:YEATS domain-containing protein n=1 Tax=Pavo cristatus TaxID=9049 RepID=A0A8C9FAH8_PAVCR